MLPVVAPVFDGANLFGEPSMFSSIAIGAPIPVPSVTAYVDTFLGLTPGTTFVGCAPGGNVWACSGTMLGNTSDEIAAQQALMLSYAEIVALLGLPTAQSWPQNFLWRYNARFRAVETQFGPTVAYAGNRFSASFKVVIRTTSNS